MMQLLVHHRLHLRAKLRKKVGIIEGWFLKLCFHNVK